MCLFFFLMIRRPPRSTLDRSSAASDVYKRQVQRLIRVSDEIVVSVEKAPSKEKQEANMILSKKADKPTGYCIRTGVGCLLYTSPSPRDRTRSRMPSSA